VQGSTDLRLLIATGIGCWLLAVSSQTTTQQKASKQRAPGGRRAAWT